MVHFDNVRLEHDVALVKYVLDDKQRKMFLHSTRGVLAGERARMFQLQVIDINIIYEFMIIYKL
ncbi:unnamed protein product [Brassica napus]|uniref:(rape) hypothetical protein n=1 Tax=Brassica napus TaxID=3708 RepID=A0A816KBD8_BRANA|nr:unnamed protein product [Brassica napus]